MECLDAMPAVRARGLRKSYDGRVAVDGVDLDVRCGECFGLLGPNGAGKSTTLKMIYGLAAVDGGTLELFGRDATRDPRAAKAQIGVVPQEENLDNDLTVRENLLVQAGFHGLGRRAARARADELLAFARLADRARDVPRELSGGMRRRLLIARALVAEPRLVVLDEPSAGLDPQARQTIWRVLDELRSDGVTLLLTTHYMEEAARTCDRLVIMNHGRIVEAGSPLELIGRHRQEDLDGVFLHLTGEALEA
jgi:lipooligosaccharide transport system ATP-binding protein